MRFLTGIALLFGLLPATAIGKPFAVTENFGGDLDAVGPGAAWSDVLCKSACGYYDFDRTERARFFLKRPGQGRRELSHARLDHYAGGSNQSLERVRFAASMTHVLKVEESEGSSGDFPYADARLVAGPLGEAPLTTRLRCDAYYLRPLGATLDDDHYAYDATACDDSLDEVRVESLLDGAVRAIDAEGRYPNRLSLRGSFLALTSSERGEHSNLSPARRIAVWNWETGTKVTELTPAGSPPAPEIALGPDGELAFCDAGGVWRAPPGSTNPRPVASLGCGRLSWRGSEIVTTTGGGRLVILSPSGAMRELLDYRGVDLQGFAEDGRSLAFALPTCSGDTAIHLHRLTGPPLAAGRRKCPVSLPPQRLEMDSDRQVDLRLRCPRGCSGAIFFGASARILELERRDRSFSIRLPRQLARRVRRRGRVLLRFLVETRDRGGREVKRKRILAVVPA